jgi:hypothetical protein
VPRTTKPLALAADDRVGSYVHQGRAPARPQQGGSEPEQSVEGSQNGSSPFSLEGRELKAESSVLQQQDEGRHEPRFLGYMVTKLAMIFALGLAWAGAVVVGLFAERWRVRLDPRVHGTNLD